MYKKGFLWLLIICNTKSYATDVTHWMVTETGLIKPRLDSQYVLARPYDLLAFLDQDTLWESIISDYHDLARKQVEIDRLWIEFENHTDVDRHMTSNKNCVKAGSMRVANWYSALTEDSKSVIHSHLWEQNDNSGNKHVPDCKKISSLTFSMFAFEHLESMRNRDKLTFSPDETVLVHISQMMTIGQFGQWATGSLKSNSTSWQNYKYAAMYWIVKGNAPKAIECCRRAIHYAPREFKDVALLLLGAVLHRSKVTEDAITVLSAAVDHNPDYHMNHFILANAYAVMGDYNSSLRHYDKILKLNPTLPLPLKHRHGLLCHSMVERIMNSTRSTVKNLRQKLLEYVNIETEWLKNHAKLLKTMNHNEDYDYRNVELNCERMTSLTNLNIKNMKIRGDRNSLIKYFFDEPMDELFLEETRGIEVMGSMYKLQKFAKHVSKHAKMIMESDLQPVSATMADFILVRTHMHSSMFHEDIADLTPFAEESTQDQDVEDPKFEYETGIILFPPNMKISRNIEDFDKEPDWPTDSFCLEYDSTFPQNVDGIYPVFLPFENKGIKLTSLLTKMIGYDADQEHELPWHPPVCPTDKDIAAFAQKKSLRQPPLGEVQESFYIRRKLLEYVGDGNQNMAANMLDAEIGQRIYAAMQKELVPPWVTQTIASLYWRVKGNHINALHCLKTASKTVQPHYKDIVMTSLASVYLEMGYFMEALDAAEESFRMSPYEPATNFVLSQLNMIKKQRNTHMFHLKQSIRVDANFLDGLARRLLDAWACVLKQVDSIQEKAEYAIGDFCTPIEPGVNMVCEKDGTNCHMTNKMCQNNEKETSAIVRMLNLNDVNGFITAEASDIIFDSFIEDMPEDRKDKIGHFENYRNMVTKIDGTLLGCGPQGCKNLKPQELDLKEENCGLQYLEISYWLLIVTFKQVFTSSNLGLYAEISSLPPSDKKAPMCDVLSESEIEEDFFLERIYRIDTSDWGPIVALKEQFAETFNYFEFMSLGSKIQKYLEMSPRSFFGLLLAGWWCGAAGRGGCARRCLAAAHAHASQPTLALRPLVTVLLFQAKLQDAKDIAYLAFYSSPKSKVDAFLVAVAHAFMTEDDQAVWMYRYSLTLDEKFLPAKACLHASLCLVLFEDKGQPKDSYKQIHNKHKIYQI